MMNETRPTNPRGPKGIPTTGSEKLARACGDGGEDDRADNPRRRGRRRGSSRRLNSTYLMLASVIALDERFRFGHPSELRTISVREAARIQTFPDDYVFGTPYMEYVCGTIGNALRCDFAEALARHVGWPSGPLQKIPMALRQGLTTLASRLRTRSDRLTLFVSHSQTMRVSQPRFRKVSSTLASRSLFLWIFALHHS
jgi:hypothetical protein